MLCIIRGEEDENTKKRGSCCVGFSSCTCGNVSVEKCLYSREREYRGIIIRGKAIETLATAEESEKQIEEKEIAYEIDVDCDYFELALSLDDLIKTSDFVAEIRVEDTRAFINENNGMIQTEVVPEVIEVIKGEYEGQLLYVNGGELLYDEYIANEVIAKQLSGHENPDGDEEYNGKYVRESVDGQYIFHTGETYIFFAKRRDDTGLYYSQYAYQGTYKVEDGVVRNEALKDEPLLDDLNASFGKKEYLSESKIQDNNNKDSVMVKQFESDEVTFISSLKEML